MKRNDYLKKLTPLLVTLILLGIGHETIAGVKSVNANNVKADIAKIDAQIKKIMDAVSALNQRCRDMDLEEDLEEDLEDCQRQVHSYSSMIKQLNSMREILCQECLDCPECPEILP